MKKNTDNVIELIERIRKEDDVAFSLLCEQYKGLLLKMTDTYFKMCSKDLTERDDFAQEAKLALYNATLKYDVNNVQVSFGAFAKVCIKNRLISYLRKLNTKRKKSNSDDGEIISPSNPQDTVIGLELEKKLLYLAENVLSGYEMCIFKMMYEQGAKAKEISAKIGKSEKSVYNAIFRIRSKLKLQSKNGT